MPDEPSALMREVVVFWRRGWLETLSPVPNNFVEVVQDIQLNTVFSPPLLSAG